MSAPKLKYTGGAYDLALNLLAMLFVSPAVFFALLWRIVSHMWGRGTALWEELFAIIEGDGP